LESGNPRKLERKCERTSRMGGVGVRKGGFPQGTKKGK